MGGHQSPWILCWYMNEIQKNKDTNKISTQKSGDDRACVTISYAISDLPYYRKLTLHEIKVLEINVT